VDGSIQLLGLGYFISQANTHQGGDKRYSLLEWMMKALKYDHHTETSLETNGLVMTLEYHCTLHLILPG